MVFKINMALRLILENTENGAYRYFYAEQNSHLLYRPRFISTSDDLHSFITEVGQIDLGDYQRLQ